VNRYCTAGLSQQGRARYRGRECPTVGACPFRRPFFHPGGSCHLAGCLLPYPGEWPTDGCRIRRPNQKGEAARIEVHFSSHTRQEEVELESSRTAFPGKSGPVPSELSRPVLIGLRSLRSGPTGQALLSNARGNGISFQATTPELVPLVPKRENRLEFPEIALALARKTLACDR